MRTRFKSVGSQAIDMLTNGTIFENEVVIVIAAVLISNQYLKKDGVIEVVETCEGSYCVTKL